MNNENYSKLSSDHNIPGKQRALVLQGGGALGAYEVGVLKVLYKKRFESREDDSQDRPLFDIIAGTSIGAMSAAVLVSNVVNRHKTWKEAVQVLEDFWMKGLSSAPDISTWVNDAKKRGTITGSAEAVRRHYSVKETSRMGPPMYVHLRIRNGFQIPRSR